MHKYVYAFYREVQGEDVFFRFPKLPQITSCISTTAEKTMTASDLEHHVIDAVITALHGCMIARIEIPDGDDSNLVRADGFVELSVQQAMKLELYSIYVKNCRSMQEFAKQINKHETAVRRLLNLRHPSLATEIEATVEFFEKRLVHHWSVETIGPYSYSGRKAITSGRLE